ARDWVPPPASLFPVAQARRLASDSGTPRSSYPSAMCSALRFCLSVYFDLSPLGMVDPPSGSSAESTWSCRQNRCRSSFLSSRSYANKLSQERNPTRPRRGGIDTIRERRTAGRCAQACGILESVPAGRSDGYRVGTTHQRKALASAVIGGVHPPYEIHLPPFRNRLTMGYRPMERDPSMSRRRPLLSLGVA